MRTAARSPATGAGSSHSSHAGSGSTTGMRSWTGSSSAFASVVTIEHERSQPSSLPMVPTSGSGTFHTAHSPANAIGSPSRRWMKNGSRRARFVPGGGGTRRHS